MSDRQQMHEPAPDTVTPMTQAQQDEWCVVNGVSRAEFVREYLCQECEARLVANGHLCSVCERL